MLLEIRGYHLPGRAWEEHSNIHVGIQIGREPAELVPADAASAVWVTEVSVVAGPDFRGPAVQGKKGERFVSPGVTSALTGSSRCSGASS